MFNATETALFINLIHCSFMAQSTAFTIGKYFRKTGLGIAKIVTTKTIETLPLMSSNVADYRIKRHLQFRYSRRYGQIGIAYGILREVATTAVTTCKPDARCRDFDDTVNALQAIKCLVARHKMSDKIMTHDLSLFCSRGQEERGQDNRYFCKSITSV